MPDYIVLIICVYILAVSGVLKSPCKALGVSVPSVCYMALCTLALSIFQLRIGVEVNVNVGALALALLPGLILPKSEGKTEGLGGAVMIAVVTVLLKRSGSMYGAESGLLCGILAGLAGMVMWQDGAAAMCAAAGIPLMAAAADAAVSLLFSGYGAVEIGHDTIAAQLIAMGICMGIIWMRSLEAKRAGAE